MKFNEKLIELRKKAGLSQEELGFKLNVTRQTVSKWELGLTTPEMDKLSEMGKIFNVSVDELINDSETISNNTTVIDDQPVQDAKSSNGKWLGIVIAIVAIIIIVPIIFLFFIAGNIFGIFNKFNNNENEKEGILGFIQGVYDDISEGQMLMNNDFNISSFNSSLELYKGENSGSFLKSLLDKVIESNKTEERKIAVRYNEIDTQNTDEIQEFKLSLNDDYNFDVVFEYDEEGYINALEIERVFTEFEISKFNSGLELRAGTQWGSTVKFVLDEIITSNKTEERKITVKYNDVETQDEEEIKNIKRKLGDFVDYEITCEYDENGFINKAIIEKI